MKNQGLRREDTDHWIYVAVCVFLFILRTTVIAHCFSESYFASRKVGCSEVVWGGPSSLERVAFNATPRGNVRSMLQLILSLTGSQVPLQNNTSDCGVFALLFILHLRHGGINHVRVPVQYRMEMEGEVCGKVVGGLLGVRLSFVEEIVSSAEHFDTEAPDASDVLYISD